jgi:hypothetical protein
MMTVRVNRDLALHRCKWCQRLVAESLVTNGLCISCRTTDKVRAECSSCGVGLIIHDKLEWEPARPKLCHHCARIQRTMDWMFKDWSTS